MVVVVMAEEHEIDRWQILKPYPRCPMPPRPRKRHRRHPLRPHRIGEDVDPIHLNERGRMIDEGDPQSSLPHPLRRRRTIDRFRMLRPLPPLPRRLPLQQRPLGPPPALTAMKPLPITAIADRPPPPHRCEEDSV